MPQRPKSQALDRLLRSPEYLIRRAHQTAGSLFASACAELDLTPSQYAALCALASAAPLGQNELGRMIALDRATTSLVVRLLCGRGWVEGRPDPQDRRRLLLELSAAGRDRLHEAERLARRARRRLLAALDDDEEALFLHLLARLDQAHGEASSD